MNELPRRLGQRLAIGGTLVAAVGNALASPLLWALGADASSAGFALEYLRPMLLCVSFNYLNILYGSTLRGVGNTRLPFGVGVPARCPETPLTIHLQLHGVRQIGKHLFRSK